MRIKRGKGPMETTAKSTHGEGLILVLALYAAFFVFWGDSLQVNAHYL